jgi:hypothetical protein
VGSCGVMWGHVGSCGVMWGLDLVSCMVVARPLTHAHARALSVLFSALPRALADAPVPVYPVLPPHPCATPAAPPRPTLPPPSSPADSQGRIISGTPYFKVRKSRKIVSHWHHTKYLTTYLPCLSTSTPNFNSHAPCHSPSASSTCTRPTAR